MWIFEADGRVISTPVVKNSLVFIRTKDSIYALDGMSGKIIWQAKSRYDYYLSVAPQTFENYLIVPEKYSRVGIFDIKTGQRIWQFLSNYEGRKDANFNSNVEELTCINNILYVARKNWKLSSYDLINNLVNWENNVEGRTSLYIAADDQAVYLGSGHSLLAYEAKTGKKLWQIDYESFVGPILLDGTTLFVTLNYLNDTRLVALDLGTLLVKWQINYNLINETLINSLTIEGGVLYAGGSKLTAISKDDGSIMWSTREIGNIGKPVVINNKIYVRNTKTSLFEFDIETGQELGYLLIRADTPMKNEPERGPAVADDLLIIPFGDNRVFAYLP